MTKTNPRIFVAEWLYRTAPYINLMGGAAVWMAADSVALAGFGAGVALWGMRICTAREFAKEIGW